MGTKRGDRRARPSAREAAALEGEPRIDARAAEPPGAGRLPAAPRVLVEQLRAWFDVHKRDLPWRVQRSPYRVWLSEVMLQQTQVAVVEDYYRRFLARFPDVAALARASDDEVLSLWSGLGYYSRGRNLHKAARVVATTHGGIFPSTALALRQLPGVGPYTAAAVASLAYDEPVAVVDGNVARVLSRLTDERRPVDSPAGHQSIATHAQALVDASDRPGATNEALMELGALVCVPRAPRCGACPWRDACAGRRIGSAEDLPVKLPKRARRVCRVASVVVVDEVTGAVWLEKRPARGLFGGLHEPPSCEIAEDVEGAWRALLRARDLPVPPSLPEPILVTRRLTHRDLTFAALRVTVSSTHHPGPWVEDITAVGVSTAVRAVLEATGAAAPAVSGRRGAAGQ